MPKRTKPVSVTELRANLSRVVRRARSSHEPIVVTERGRPSAVLLSLEAYTALRGNPEREMLRSILDTIPQRVFWKDVNSNYLGCNRPFAQDAGVGDPAKIVGKSNADTAAGSRRR